MKVSVYRMRCLAAQVLFAACFLFVSSPARASAEEEPDIFTTFRSVKDDFAEYRKKINESIYAASAVKIQIEALRKRIKSSTKIPPDAKELLLANVDLMEEKVKSQISDATKLDEFFKHADALVDAAAAVNDLYKTYESTDGAGPLQQQLKVLGKSMETFGEYLPPGMDEVVTQYGKVTQDVIAATERLEKKIKDDVDQDTIGTGAHTYIFSERKKQASEIVGPDKTLIAIIPGLLYEVLGTDANGLIWDEKAKKWYKVPNAEDARLLFYDSIIGGNRLDASQLHYLATNPKTVKEMRTRAEAIAKALYLVVRARQTDKITDETYQRIFVKNCDQDVLQAIIDAGIDPLANNFGKSFILRCMFGKIVSGTQDAPTVSQFSALAAESVRKVHQALVADLRAALQNEGGIPGRQTLELHDVAVRMPHWAAYAGIKLERIIKLSVRVDPAEPVKPPGTFEAEVTVTDAGKNVIAKRKTVKRIADFYGLSWKPYTVRAAAEPQGEAVTQFAPGGHNPSFVVRLIIGDVSGTVTLTIRYDRSKKPVEGACVVLKGPAPFKGTASQGIMHFRKVPPGKYTMHVSAPGCTTYSRPFDVGPREDYKGNVWMTVEQLIFEGNGVATFKSRKVKFQPEFSAASQPARLLINLQEDGTIFGRIFYGGWCTTTASTYNKVEAMKGGTQEEHLFGTYRNGVVEGYINHKNRPFKCTYTDAALNLYYEDHQNNGYEEWHHTFTFENIPRKK